MEYLEYLELVTFFTESINSGFAELRESINKENFTIIIDYITARQIENLYKKGYFVSIFAENEKRIKLIISKL